VSLEQLKIDIAAFAKERDWEQFHTPKNLAMAMSVEASEVVEIFQWLTDKQAASFTPEQLEHLKDELGDTFIYLLKLADKYKIDLVDAAASKLEKTKLKYPVEKAKGRMTKYDKL
jgi:dCTP diphosphatase